MLFSVGVPAPTANMIILSALFTKEKEQGQLIDHCATHMIIQQCQLRGDRARLSVPQRTPDVPVASSKGKNNEAAKIAAPNQTLIAHTQLPEYVEQLSCQLALEDWTYLYRKGAMAVPDRSVALDIFGVFLDHVYPLMPVVELDLFFDALSSDLSRVKVNLFVLKSMISASIKFLPRQLLLSIGYEKFETAQKEYAQQTKAWELHLSLKLPADYIPVTL